VTLWRLRRRRYVDRLNGTVTSRRAPAATMTEDAAARPFCPRTIAATRSPHGAMPAARGQPMLRPVSSTALPLRIASDGLRDVRNGPRRGNGTSAGVSTAGWRGGRPGRSTWVDGRGDGAGAAITIDVAADSTSSEPSTFSTR